MGRSSNQFYEVWSLLSLILPTHSVAQENDCGDNRDHVYLQALVWICVLDLEANKSRRLVAVPDIAIVGSPTVSSDETPIAFDGAYEISSKSLADGGWWKRSVPVCLTLAFCHDVRNAQR